ncbi:putative ribonuclease P [Microsporum canis]
MAKTKLGPALVFERKNKNLLKIPKKLIVHFCSDARIEKRPIPHPPAASPYAGANVPKVVYVSTKSPFMSIAKRVQKLLREAEKRATQSVCLGDKGKTGKDKLAQLKGASEALRKEPVFIKATGRAIDKAMKVGKWFDEKDGFTIKVKTGAVLVVDDIVQDEDVKDGLADSTERSTDEAQKNEGQEQLVSKPGENMDATGKKGNKIQISDGRPNSPLPDSRTRWVNMVEIEVTMQ